MGCLSLREKCPNTELFLVRIFLYLDWIRRDTQIFIPNTGKYGPEISPYLDTFHAVFLPIYFLFFSNFLFFFGIKFRGTLDPPLVFSGCKMFLGEKVSFGLYFSFVIVYKIKWYIYKIKWYINKKCVDLLKKSLQISLRRNY